MGWSVEAGQLEQLTNSGELNAAASSVVTVHDRAGMGSDENGDRHRKE